MNFLLGFLLIYGLLRTDVIALLVVAYMVFIMPPQHVNTETLEGCTIYHASDYRTKYDCDGQHVFRDHI